jgi:hypothetical protein
MFRAVVFRDLSDGQSLPMSPTRRPRKGRNDIESARYDMKWRSGGLACKPLRTKAGCAPHGR